MPLYPFTVIDAATLSLEPNLILAGTLVTSPLDMTTVEMTQIIVQQLSATQDFSLRAWISVRTDGIPLGDGDYAVMRSTGSPIIVYVAGQIPPTPSFKVLVRPGHYYVNILNLTNEDNYFGFSKTDLT